MSTHLAARGGALADACQERLADSTRRAQSDPVEFLLSVYDRLEVAHPVDAATDYPKTPQAIVYSAAGVLTAEAMDRCGIHVCYPDFRPQVSR